MCLTLSRAQTQAHTRTRHKHMLSLGHRRGLRSVLAFRLVLFTLLPKLKRLGYR
jgi:hypothetical protein